MTTLTVIIFLFLVLSGLFLISGFRAAQVLNAHNFMQICFRNFAVPIMAFIASCDLVRFFGLAFEHFGLIAVPALVAAHFIGDKICVWARPKLKEEIKKVIDNTLDSEGEIG